MDNELVELTKSFFRALPAAWRPAVVMGLIAAAMVYGYFAKIATPINDAAAAGINNTAAIDKLDRKSEERNQQVQKRLNSIEGNQSSQNQKMDDMAGQLNIILQVMLTGQRPAAKSHK